MKITNFGTTALLFEDEVKQIMFDPHFTKTSAYKSDLGRNYIMQRFVA